MIRWRFCHLRVSLLYQIEEMHIICSTGTIALVNRKSAAMKLIPI